MTHRRIVVGTDAVPIVTYFANRSTLIVQSLSTNAVSVFINEDPQNVLADGLELLSGDSYSKVKALGDEPEKALWAQTTAGTVVLLIVEQYFTSEGQRKHVGGEI